ncbi:hypothetical protein CBD41_00750 [bacterium TMED181]|nr:hypothetical protein [Planctomycetota bacterium]OUW47513.1 MAG: hypothetical protein CBD41_00750 [bacterium TMED181]
MDTPEYSGFCPQKHLGGTAGCHIWEGEYHGQGQVILKTFAPGRGWQQEREALRSIPKIDLPQGILTPRILKVREQPPALLMTRLGGTNMEQGSFSTQDWSQANRRAARFLKSWQQQPFQDEDVIPLSTALPQRLESWIDNGKQALQKHEIDGARKRVGDGSLFSNQSRVPCHNDFQPRNWLWDGHQLAVIDFEHARPNHPAFDWVRLEVGLWQKIPELKDEFIEEWGELPEWASAKVMDAIIGLHAIGCIVWGHLHEDREFIFEGRRILDE